MKDKNNSTPVSVDWEGFSTILAKEFYDSIMHSTNWDQTIEDCIEAVKTNLPKEAHTLDEDSTMPNRITEPRSE